MMKACLLFSAFILLIITHLLAEEIPVQSLNELNEAIAKSGNLIRLAPGDYDLKDLSNSPKILEFSGSNNTIDLTDAYINVTVGTVNSCYLLFTGHKNTLIGGEFEDTYNNGLKEVTDFIAYNKDIRNLARGLGDGVMHLMGNHNTIKNTKLTVRGSFPYGYGSYYGLNNRECVFGLSKRSGILIRGSDCTLDSVEVQQRAFGHGIFMQKRADNTVIKNCLVEGRLRKTADILSETDPSSMAKRSNYRIPRDENRLIPKDEYVCLSEDGIRMYSMKGSVTVENCTVKRMRGGIRLYLGGPATVTNCTAIECEYTNFNLPNHGVVTGSKGDFSYGPLSDYRLNRSNTKAEWTVLPSPNASGGHNLMDVQGHNHHITLNRTDGPIDSEEKRAIVVTGNGSTIINHTEYAVVLAEGTEGNTIQSFGPVTDNGVGNRVTKVK